MPQLHQVLLPRRLAPHLLRLDALHQLRLPRVALGAREARRVSERRRQRRRRRAALRLLLLRRAEASPRAARRVERRAERRLGLLAEDMRVAKAGELGRVARRPRRHRAARARPADPVKVARDPERVALPGVGRLVCRRVPRAVVNAPRLLVRAVCARATRKEVRRIIRHAVPQPAVPHPVHVCTLCAAHAAHACGRVVERVESRGPRQRAAHVEPHVHGVDHATLGRRHGRLARAKAPAAAAPQQVCYQLVSRATGD
eukprot:2983505-Prymnesium_polylepis.1